SLIAEQHLVCVKVPETDAHDYPHVPDASPAFVVEQAARRSKRAYVPVEDRVRVLGTRDHAQSASASKHFLDHRLRESLFDTVLQAGVLEHRHRDSLDVRREALAFARGLVAANVK